MSGHVIRGGRHFVEFAVNSNAENAHAHLGIIRPVSLTNAIGLEANWGGGVYPTNVSTTYKSAVAEKLRSQRTAKWGDSNIHCCTYYCDHGRCYWADWNNQNIYSSEWQGREGLTRSGTIGLLLDLNEGTLSVFKNGRLLGVLKNGLDGEYCWFVAVSSTYTIRLAKGKAPE